MPNDDMVEYWNTRGAEQWVAECDRYDRLLAPCGSRLFDAACLKPGESVLDIGCGNGATTIEASRRVGPTGSVTGIDLSSAMLALATKRAGEQAVPATFVRGDVQVGDLGGPFDVVISRFGVMFFDDPDAAFANIAGSLRPGGRLAFVCWRDLLSNAWAVVPMGGIVGVVGMPEAPEPGAPGPFAFADPERVERILMGAGFRDVAVEAADDQLHMGSDADDVTSFMASNEMARRLLEGKSAEQVTAALAAARDAVAAFAGPDGVVMGGAYWVVSARRD